MKREELIKNKNLIAKVFTLLFFLFLFIFIIRLGYLCLTGKVDGIDLKSFSNKRNTKKETLYALRGNIYDINGEILAQTINSYTIIAYLDSSRSEGYSEPKHVVDKELTAEKLSTVLDMSKEKILERLNKDAYQVEFGTSGKGLTELQKEAIEALELPGIDFITTHKRYYPNNTFLSYVIGYTTEKDNVMTGEMGIEKYYNDVMTGVNGFVEYQKDLNGYKFPNSEELRKEKVDGNDVYLTIDSNVQMSLETVVNKAQNESSSDWIIAVVLDAKTGKILGSATSPTFNPNTKDISNYLNPLVSYTYEPGSVMKTYSYMAAIENNPTWDFNTDTCYTAPYTIGEDTVSDWNKTGWGEISYKKGYTLSSNTCVANMIKNYLSKDKLMQFYKKIGFGSLTNIDLPNEYKGKVNFKYDVEVVNAGFGQGITTTPIQQVKALTMIANNGVLLTPYIVEKTVNSSTGEVTYQAKVKEEKVVSSETVNKIKDLMFAVVNSDSSETTGSNYKMDGYDLIGKTGTAQIANSKTGKYYTGKYDYITSFAGMYPKDNPEVIIYVAMQRSKNSKVLPETVKTIVKDTSKYLGIFEEAPELNKEVTTYKFKNYKNKNITEVKEELDSLQSLYVVFGNGTKVIDQYPNKNTKVNTKEKVFLFTNDDVITMPDLTNYSFKDADVVLTKLGIKHECSSNGYVSYQSVSAGSIITDDTVVTLN